MLSILGFHEKTIKTNGTMAGLIESLWMDHEKPKRKYVLSENRHHRHSLDTRVYHHHYSNTCNTTTINNNNNLSSDDQHRHRTSSSITTTTTTNNNTTSTNNNNKPPTIILKSFCFSPSDFNDSKETDWIELSCDKNNNTNNNIIINKSKLSNDPNDTITNRQSDRQVDSLFIEDCPSDNVRVLTSSSDYMFPQSFFIHHLNPDRYFIAKVFPKTKKLSKARELRKERKLWQKVSTNDNFLPLFGVLEIDNSICLLTENVPYISLKNLIGNKCLVESDVIDISAQLVLALGYLHDNNILHRGLHSQVVFINWRGLIKISDLSTCEEKGKCLSSILPSTYKLSYCAPEVLLGLPYGIGSDWWSLGLIIYELLTGKVIADSWDNNLLCKRIVKENCKDILQDLIRYSSKIPNDLSDEAKSLLKALLEKDEKKRLKWTRSTGIQPIMNQPFFSSVDWDSLQKNCGPGLGKIVMDLTLCSWYPDIIRVHQILGPDLGSIWGNCHLISNHKTSEKGMMKVIWKCKMRRKRNGWKQVMNERLIWSKMSTSSPYILPMIGFFETEATYSFVSNYIPSGVSLSCVIQSSPLPETVIRLVTGELALALDSVHRQGILLRHLSPDSILIEASGRIWLTDFTWAKVTRYSRKGHFEPEYMAPEVIQGLQFGKQSDWFALGIIVFQLVTGLTPLTIYCTKKGLNEDNLSTETLLRAMETIPKLLEDDSFSPAIRSLLKDILAFEPNKRLGNGRNCLKRIKEHVFFKGLVWKKLEQAKEFS